MGAIPHKKQSIFTMKYIVNAASFDKAKYDEPNQAYVVKTSDNVHLVNNITKGTQDRTQN